jgi:hypothetical protein
MAMAKIRIEFNSDSNHPIFFEKSVEFTNLRQPGGDEFVANVALAEFEKASLSTKYFDDMPVLDGFVRDVNLSFRIEDLITGVHDDRVNARELWHEISHILHRVRYLLAQSRAYHDLEQIYNSKRDDNSKYFAWHFHLDKIERFYLAVILLGKISDSTARLVFERLGASLIPNLDRTKPEWERQINLTNVRKGLKDRTGNSYVASLTDADYASLHTVLDDFLASDELTRIWTYRVKFVHRVTPSVDRSDLYPHLQSRKHTPTVDSKGKVTGWHSRITVSKPDGEYAFLDLYNDAIETFKHFITMLERLEKIAPFGLDVAAFKASA